MPHHDPTPDRALRFIGSLPPDVATTPSRAMGWVLDRIGGHSLTAMPCDPDANWIVDYLQAAKQRPEVFAVVRPGAAVGPDGTVRPPAHDDGPPGYHLLPVFALRKGVRLRPEHVAMNRVAAVGQRVEALRRLRAERTELAGVRLQVSQPAPLDLAMFVFAGVAVEEGMPLRPMLRELRAVLTALRHLPVFREALLREMAELHAAYGDELQWQVESPVGQLLATKTAAFGLGRLGAWLVGGTLAAFLRAIPADVDTTLHLCQGDYYNHELLAPRSLKPAVRVLNRIGRSLGRRGRRLPQAHIPCACGSHPAPTQRQFYRPLRRLQQAWRLAAGVVSAADPDGSRVALALFEEESYRRAAAVATGCGLGRDTAEEADAAVAVMRYVARHEDALPAQAA